MAGLGMALAGAVKGLGEGIVEEAENKRKNALLQLKRQQQLDDDARDRGYELEDEQRGYDREDAKVQRGSAALQGIYETDDPFFSLLNKHEGAGDATTLYGHSQREGGRFAGVDVSKMTLDEVYKFTDPSGEYGKWVADNNDGEVATPTGSGQIVGTTLKAAAEQMGLPRDTVYDEKTQRKIALFLADQRVQGQKTQEGKRKALRSEWVGLRKASDEQVDAAIDWLGNRDARTAAYDALADPDTPSDTRKAIGRGLGIGGKKSLTNHTWMEVDGRTVRMGYNDETGAYEPVLGAGGKPATGGGSRNKLSATTSADIEDLFKDQMKDEVDRRSAAIFEEEVTRLMREDDLTDREAYAKAVQAMEFDTTEKTTGKGGRFLGIDWNGKEKTVTEKGEWSGRFNYDQGKTARPGLGGTPTPEADTAAPPEADTPAPTARTAAPEQSGDLPRPKSKAEADALPSGTLYIDPTGQVRKKT